MKDINELSFLGIGWVRQNLLNDDFWKAFGLKKRPRRGKYFDFLVPRKKLAVERFLNSELLALSLVDIAQAVRPIDNYVQEHCDYRALLITGIICNAWASGLYNNLDRLLDTIRQVNEYTNHSANNRMPKILFDRLAQQIVPDKKMEAILMFGAANLLASANKGTGIIRMNEIYREQLKQYEPLGTLSTKTTKEEVDKIVWVALELINN